MLPGGLLWHPAGFSTWPGPACLPRIQRQAPRRGFSGSLSTASRVETITSMTSERRNRGQPPNTASTKHGVLLGWQSPYSTSSSQKPISHPTILKRKDVKVCPGHSTRRLHRLRSSRLSLLITFTGANANLLRLRQQPHLSTKWG